MAQGSAANYLKRKIKSSAIYETRAKERQQFAASLPHHHYARLNWFSKEAIAVSSRPRKCSKIAT